MNTYLTSTQFRSWLPWLLLIGICAVLQFLGAYPALRLELPPLHASWLFSVFSCHLVHLTLRHWLHDSLALIIIAWIFVNEYNWKSWLLTFLMSAISVSLGIVLYHAGLHSYAGLSGLLHGFFTMGCLLLYPRQPRLAIVLLVIMSLKLLLEPYYSSLLMTTQGFTVASMAHVYGVIGGLTSWLCWISFSAPRDRRVV